MPDPHVAIGLVAENGLDYPNQEISADFEYFRVDSLWPADNADLNNSRLPTVISLAAAYPNPFNPTTQISFSLPKTEHVQLTVFNLLGRKVMTLADKRYPAGYQSIVFDGADLPSGIYFYSLTTASGFRQTKKMVLMK